MVLVSCLCPKSILRWTRGLQGVARCDLGGGGDLVALAPLFVRLECGASCARNTRTLIPPRAGRALVAQPDPQSAIHVNSRELVASLLVSVCVLFPWACAPCAWAGRFDSRSLGRHLRHHRRLAHWPYQQPTLPVQLLVLFESGRAIPRISDTFF